MHNVFLLSTFSYLLSRLPWQHGSRCGGVRVGTGRRLLTALSQVRFLSPQLDGVRHRIEAGNSSTSQEWGVNVCLPRFEVASREMAQRCSVRAAFLQLHSRW